MKDDIVRHKDLPDLGIGKVLEHAMGNKVRIFFLTCGEKKFDTNYANLIKLEGDEASHPLLDNLMVPDKEKNLSYRRIDELVDEFFKIAPDGFQDKKYREKSREKKLDLHKLLMENLGQEAFEQLLDNESYSEICEHALKVVDKINLIAPSEKKLLKAALENEDNQELFAKRLYNLIHDDQEIRIRFNRFVSCLNTIGAPKWTIQTFFLFAAHPDKYIFLKPTTSRNAAAAFSFDLNYRKELNWDTYATLLSFADYVRKELESVGDSLQPEDMIDVLSFTWSVASGKLV